MSSPGLSAEQFYVLGGTMHPGSPSYVVRQADRELVHAVTGRELCYVLASRQMGKSSLMARSANALAAHGISCAIVDVTLLSENKGEPDAWYYAFVHHLADRLGLDVNVSAWWQENSLLPPLGRMTQFLDKVVLAECPSDVVIFVDEIDSVPLPFSDDFFAGIRACHNARATDERFNRLSFVLLGVATPAQLIRDPSRTPFNVGRSIELTDFTRDEALPLAAGLHAESDRSMKMLERILFWTAGHPYLTQNLCWHSARNTTWEIDELVQQLFLSRRAAREETNLKFVRERLTQGGSGVVNVLQVYRRVVTGQPVREDPTSPVHASLKLAGLVKTDSSGELKVRNRIYERVFSENWVSLEMPEEPQPITTAPDDDVAQAYLTYDALRKLPGFRAKAIGFLSQFWECRGSRDEALLTRIWGLKQPDPGEGIGDPGLITRRWIQSLVGLDYACLAASYVHQGPVLAAGFNPNGTRVITGSADGTARLWSAISGECVLPPFRHKAAVRAVAFSPDGKSLATGSDDYTACLWDAEKGGRLGAPLTHRTRIRSVHFSPLGDKILTTSAEGSALVWHTATCEPACPPLEHQASIWVAAFSPDGATVVTGGDDNLVYRWSAASGERLGPALPHDGNVTALAFHSIGKLMATACEDGAVRLWNTDSGAAVGKKLVHEGAVLAVAFSPDGSLLLTGSADRTARLWRTDSGEPACAPMRHQDRVVAVAFRPDSGCILTGSADGTARLWSPENGQPLTPAFRHGRGLASVAFSPDGSKVLTSGEDNVARLWQAVPGGAPDSSVCAVHTHEVIAAACSPDGARVVTCGADGAARIWTAGSLDLAVPPLCHGSPIFTAAFSADGKVLATGSEDGSLRLWDTDSGRPLDQVFRHKSSVSAVAFSPHGNTFASGSDDETGQLWEVATGKPLGPPLKHRGPVRTVAFSPDGLVLVTGGHDRTARFWSAKDGSSLGSPLEHSSWVTSVAWSPDGLGLLVAAGDGSVCLWSIKHDASTGLSDPSLVFSLQHQASVEEVAFAPRGRCFLVATANWVYYYSMDEGTGTPISARLLPGHWTGAFHWSDSGDGVYAGLLDTGDRLVLRALDLRWPETPPIDGDPEGLLYQWQRRVGLYVDEGARISPTFV
ncbi:MAG TPA: AAA-like domain-containing protein [Bryobacteraceae bacterium]|nr:AAA-like domain-containing protein [Bryobacteraceae bacterium]